jgi:hypothetical protein
MSNANFKSGGAGANSSGFRARLRDASLLDLVQMECLSGLRRVVRVTSGSQVGYLYFDSGRIVHAACGDRAGEIAAVEMLQWEGGFFEPCTYRQWPEEPTIDSAFQPLLMRAALAKDHAQMGQVVTLPVARPEPEPAPKTPSSLPDLGTHAVRLSEQGAVLASRGDADELAPIVAFVARAGELIAESLGLERLVSVEAQGASGRTILLVDDDRSVLGFAGCSEPEANELRGEAKL